MKYLSVIAIASFLLLGCQSVGAENGSNKLIAKNEELVEETSEDKKVKGLRTAKPIVCVSNVKLLAHLKSIGEVPYAVWFDEAFGHPVIMLVNVETGSLTILEYPYEGKEKGTPNAVVYEGLACILSAGVALDTMKSNAIKAKKIEILYKR